MSNGNATQRATKREIRLKKEKMGYSEEKAPTCGNCVHRKPQPNSSRVCMLGGFFVNDHAICNKWAGLDGSTLED